MRIIRNVLVCALLLVAATAGSATAGALIGSARIKDNTVAGVDVRDGSLTATDVRNGTLELSDLAPLEAGPQGPQGSPGLPGTNGVPGLQYRNTPVELNKLQQKSVTSECLPEEMAIAGGVSSSAPGLVTVRRSFPDGDHWTAEVVNDKAPTKVTVYVWAVCIPE